MLMLILTMMADLSADTSMKQGMTKHYLTLTVNDESTEASTIVISGLELYLDRTLPVGGYALQNVGGVDLAVDRDRQSY